MPTSPQSNKDLAFQKAHILTYISEIAGQLSDMARRADCDALSDDLKQVVARAQALQDSSHQTHQ